MKRVVLESPFAGDRELHVAYATEALLDSLRRGEAPICSHLLHTRVLSDDDPDDRRLGIAAGHQWIPAADAVVVYSDLGVSRGMQAGISVARNCNVPVEIRRIREEGDSE